MVTMVRPKRQPGLLIPTDRDEAAATPASMPTPRPITHRGKPRFRTVFRGPPIVGCA